MGGNATMALCAVLLMSGVARQDAALTLKSAVEMSTGSGTVCSVDYSYSFPGRTLVHIRGVGTAPAEGRFQYLTLEREIVFLDGPDGTVLARLPIEEPVHFMGTESVTLPDPAAFSAAALEGIWKSSESFQLHALDVLNRKFKSGRRVFEDSEKLNNYLTTFTSLEGLPENLRGEVAVMVLHRAPAGNEPLNFRVRFASRERRSHTGWRTEVSEEVRKKAEDFVHALLKELQADAVEDQAR